MAYRRLGTTKNGERYVDITVKNKGERKTKRWLIPDGWSDKSIERELKKVERDLERDFEDGKIKSFRQRKEEKAIQEIERSKIKTFEQYVDDIYMPSFSLRCSIVTVYNWKLTINKHILPRLADCKMPEIEPLQINDLLNEMIRKGYKQSTRVRVYTILNGIFKEAYLNDTIGRNPMDKVLRPKPTNDEAKDKEVQRYTESEARFILDKVQEIPLKWRLMITMMLDTGIRRGEACALKWESVDFINNEITIERSAKYTTTDGIQIGITKNGKKRTLSISPDIVKMLKEMRASQTKAILEIGEKASEYVFTQDDINKPMHPDSPTKYFSKFGKKYGIDNFHPHKLRHTYASISITNNADFVSVSENLGHADASFTLKQYAHADEQSRKKASNIVRDALNMQRVN